MSKVTFEYDGNEEYDEVRDIVNLRKFRCIIYKLDDFRRSLNKGTNNNIKYLYGDRLYQLNELTEDMREAKDVMTIDDVVNELNDILNEVGDMI